ncbi:MAG: hypothetical protein IKK34_07030 [Clostridia bacterium]|nr:hypothetical protein [Clostridia bacterium]
MLHAADGLIAHVTDILRAIAATMIQGAAMALMITALLLLAAYAAGIVTAAWQIAKDQRKKNGRRMP